MNIFELGAFLGILIGATAAYQFVSPYHGVLFSVFAAVLGAGAGYFVGIVVSLLFMLLLAWVIKAGQFVIKGFKQ